MNISRKFIAIAITLGITASNAIAHTVLAGTIAMQAQVSVLRTAETGLPAIVSVNLSNVPIQQAIKTIALDAGLRVSFSERVFPPNLRVTLKDRRITAQRAIEQMLAGTGVMYRVVDGGQLLFTRTGQQKQGQGTITGKVTDAKTGKGIAGASVSLESGMYKTISSDDGSYRLSGVIAGAHTVIVRLVGYAKQTRMISVGDDATVTVDFKLEPSASVLNEVVVTGMVVATELKAVPNAITVVTAKQIEERGITKIDQLFRGEIPGLFALNLGSFSVLDEVVMYSRGASASGFSAGSTLGTTPIKTYIDGIEMADPKYLSQIDPASIERIEILTGSQASTIYGANAINGVMQIFTKRGKSATPQLVLALESGVAQNNFSSKVAPNHLADARISGTEGRLSYAVGGSLNYVGSWTPGNQLQRLGVNGGVRIGAGKLTADLSARQGRTINKQTGILTAGVTKLRETGYWPYAVSIGFGPFRSTLLSRTTGLTLGYRPASWWSHELTIGADAANTESIKPIPGISSPSDTGMRITPTTMTRASQSYTTTLQLPVSSLARMGITLGADHWRTRANSWTAVPNSLTGTLNNVIEVIRGRPYKNHGAFVQGQLGIKEALFFTYGVRTDWNPTFGEKARVVPGRYGVSYTRDIPTPLGMVSTKFRGSYGRSIRPPRDSLKFSLPQTGTSAIDLFGPHMRRLANEELGPETQQGGEGGLELYFGNRASLVVTRYNQTVNDLINSITGVDSVRSLFAPVTFAENGLCSSIFRDGDGYCYTYQFQFLNVGSLRNQGWELHGSTNLGRVVARGTYSWTKSRVIGITRRYSDLLKSTDWEPGRALELVPEHTWALGVTYTHSAGSIALSVNGTGMLYTRFDPLSLEFATRLVEIRPRFSTPTYRAINPGYAMADLNVTHRFGKNVDALLQVVNLTDYYRQDFSAQYATMGRQTKAGFRVRR